MPLLIGVLLALGVGLLGSTVGWYRDRSFYLVVTVVVGLYYVLFAAMGATSGTLLEESLVAVALVVAAVIRFKKSLWVAMAALAPHGIFDLTHAVIISNPGVPVWWPNFCLAFDVSLPLNFAWQLKSGKIRASMNALVP